MRTASIHNALTFGKPSVFHHSGFAVNGSKTRECTAGMNERGCVATFDNARTTMKVLPLWASSVAGWPLAELL